MGQSTGDRPYDGSGGGTQGQISDVVGRFFEGVGTVAAEVAQAHASDATATDASSVEDEASSAESRSRDSPHDMALGGLFRLGEFILGELAAISEKLDGITETWAATGGTSSDATMSGRRDGRVASARSAQPDGFAEADADGSDLVGSLRLLGSDSPALTAAQARLAGPRPRTAVIDALNTVVGRHPPLQTCFVETGRGGVGLRYRTAVDAPAEVIDVTSSGVGVVPDEAVSAVSAPLEIEPGVAPWRAVLVGAGEDVDTVLFGCHPLAADRTSVVTILEQLVARLDGVSNDEVDAARDWRSLETELLGRAGRERMWWEQEGADRVEDILDGLAARPGLEGTGPTRCVAMIDEVSHRTAKALAARCSAEPSDVYLALWAVLLYRLSGAAEINIQVNADLRPPGRHAGIVGPFSQLLPIWVNPSGADSLADVVGAVRDRVRTVRQHAPASTASVAGPDSIVFTYDAAPTRTSPWKGLVETLPGRGASSGLRLELAERGGGDVECVIESVALDESQATGLIEALSHLVRGLARTTDPAVVHPASLPLVTGTALEQIRSLGTGPAVDPVTDLSVMIQDALGRHADRVAVRFGVESLTYAELDQRSRELAQSLRDAGVEPGDVVGILLPSSPEYIASMLAVRRLGAAWLPMDVEHPADRLRYMIDTAAPSQIICSADVASELELGDQALIPASRSSRVDVEFVRSEADDLAYVIFTSGSTGNPKGVRVSAGSLANFLVGLPAATKWQDSRTVANLTTPAFDIYVLETLATLVTGGTVAIPPPGRVRTPQAIADFLTEQAVNYLQVTPSRLRLLFADRAAATAALESVDRLFVGGEAFPEDLLDDLLAIRSLDLFNLYGPTETCVWSSLARVTGTGHVPLGRAIANTTLQVLDTTGHPLPQGLAGDLWIGGLGVSPGYLDRSDLDEAAFEPDPVGGGLRYRTGDRAVWRNGELYYLGRLDNQVKVRGVRMELEEIERAMTRHPKVVAAASLVDELTRGNHILRGFYQVRPGHDLAPADLRSFLAEKLTGPMVPGTLMMVPSIPMTSSGKVDRKLVRRRVTDLDSWVNDGPRETAAQPDLVQLLRAAWQRVLGDIPIAGDDSFFDLGGNSLSVVLLREELNKVFPGLVDVTELFANATFARLHAHLEHKIAQQQVGRGGRDVGVRLPEAWQTTAGTGRGRVEAQLPGHVQTRLGLLTSSDGSRPDGASVLHATFALAVHKLVGTDVVTMWVPDSGAGFRQARIDFSGKVEFGDIIETYIRQRDAVGPGRGAAALVADSRSSGQSTIVVLGEGDAHGLEHLSEFDIVLQVDDPARPTKVILSYAQGIHPRSMESVLVSTIKLLGVVVRGARPVGAADAASSTGGQPNSTQHDGR